ncbi:MAG TPA: D-alanyl-D-alanine carboxypeptidase family protein, partial [Blastocatellia bacterium]|nr:D-alanyl-D-alanine carboxypeptidase family protein [Blastocatellia bacterium]
DLNAAIRDLKRVGIKPEITSTWRSSQDQSWIYHCTSSRTCRSSHPGLYKALPPGQSAHEAGLAIDVSGIATGPRGDKHLTRQGRRIVQVMTSHGFHWRYGLADPVHFEANPKDYGYRTLKQAIWVNQTRCEAKIALAKSARGMKSIGVGRRADNRRVSQIRGKHARKGERGSSSTKQKGHNSARVLRAGTPAKVRATHG